MDLNFIKFKNGYMHMGDWSWNSLSK